MIPVPGPWPIGNVLSVGDLIIFIGAFIVLHYACGSRLVCAVALGAARQNLARCARFDRRTSELPLATASFLACLATILELRFEDLPVPSAGEDPTGWTVSRWLGGLGLGLARIADAASFSWPGPWIARAGGRFVVMYGVPSGVVWDPAGGAGASEIELRGRVYRRGRPTSRWPDRRARPRRPARAASRRSRSRRRRESPPSCWTTARALAGRGLEGDRHVAGTGTFPSGLPGSALTMIEAEVCESFDPPLEPGEHRRNVVTRGIDLNGLVGHEFTIGEVRCRGHAPVRAVHGRPAATRAARCYGRSCIAAACARTSCATARSGLAIRSGPPGMDARRNGPRDAERSEAQ